MLSARLYSSVLVVTRRRRARLTAKTQLAADNELSVKNGAELLDRLIKDIVAESAASYVSILHAPGDTAGEGASDEEKPAHELPTAFSLERFLPLLEERIHVLSPFTRIFLVAWIMLLDSIPDLELVAYLPRFLGGLFKFLSDENQDVNTATQTTLDRFLSEIRKIARIKQGIAESKKSQADEFNKSTSSFRSGADADSDTGSSAITDRQGSSEEKGDEDNDSASIAIEDDKSASGDGDWVPGQDVQVDHHKILEILVKFLETPFGDKGMHTMTAARHTLANAGQKLRIMISSLRPCVGSIASSKSVPKRSCRSYQVCSRTYYQECRTTSSPFARLQSK